MSISQITPKPLQITAAVIGNALEWYDFIVFGFFTVVISRLFFPSDSQYASLLLTTGTFGVGFFMRPVGGILLGIYADRRGRKAALLMVIILMTVAIDRIRADLCGDWHRGAAHHGASPAITGIFGRR